MKVDQKKVISNLQTTGLNLVGAGLGYAAVRKMPAQASKYSGLIVLGAGIFAQLSSNKTIQEIGSGIAVIGAIKTVDTYLPASLKAQTANFLPALGEVEDNWGIEMNGVDGNDDVQALLGLGEQVEEVVEYDTFAGLGSELEVAANVM